MKTAVLIVLATVCQRCFHVLVQEQMAVISCIHLRAWLRQHFLMNALRLIISQKMIKGSIVKFALLKDLRMLPHRVPVKVILSENSLKNAGVNVGVACSVGTV
jgi:hypothetical protein